MALAISLLLLAVLAPACAYIPAVATNDTDPGIQGGPNVTDVSRLNLQWYPLGSYAQTVSYQLAANDSTGFSQGALVHFGEEMINNDTTTTPWIALVSCDANATDASMEDDIFTLARDRGAVSALLYSKYSRACIINSEYSDPANFEQIMDIFSTQNLSIAQLIEERFSQVNSTLYSKFNASRLNQSQSLIDRAIHTGNVDNSTYLFATLTAYNATQGPMTSSGGVATPTTTATTKHGSSTSLAMVILYAITGVVSALFCVVIISGAIRAIRHPERYGPRGPSDFGGGQGQTRTQGLTRAFLDTFPVIKFGGPVAVQQEDKTRDVEARGPSTELGHAVELHDWQVVDEYLTADGRRASTSSAGKRASVRPRARAGDEGEGGIEEVPVPERRARPPRAVTQSVNDPVVPDQIGRETCPICIVDFEEGDDLRVLPCVGHHRFHQQCVDPWLLELSSSCPICRQDFSALEAMLSGQARDTDTDALEPPHAAFASAGENRSSFAARFSRYVRNARRHRHAQVQEEPR